MTAYAPQSISRLTLVDGLSYALLAVGVYMSSMKNLHFRGDLQWGDVPLLLALAPALYGRLARRSPILLPPMLLVAVGMMALGEFFVSWDPELNSNYLRLAKFIFASCVFPLLIAWQVYRDEKQIRLLAAIWVAGVLTSAIAAISRHHNVDLPFLTAHATTNGQRECGLSGHPGILGLLCALAIPFALALAVEYRSRLVRWGWVLAACLLVYTTNLTGSRSSLLAGLAAAAGLFVLLPDYRRRWNNVALVLVGAALVAGVLLQAAMHEDDDIDPGSPPSALARLFGQADTLDADTEREQRQDVGLRAFLASPLYGSGYTNLTEAHNIFIAFLQCGGLIGLTGFLLIMANAIACYLRLLLLTRRSREGLPNLQEAARMAFIAWMMIDWFEPILQERGQYVPFGIVFALFALATSRRAMAADSAALAGASTLVRQPRYAVSGLRPPPGRNSGM